MKTNKWEFFPIPRTLYPIPKHLCLLLVFLANLAFSQTVWDGTVNTDWYTSNTGASSYTITNAEQLAGLVELVNGGNSFEGKTITLGNDIVLNETSNLENWETNPPTNLWTEIGGFNYRFSGTFDGNGHIVSGMAIISDSGRKGLFGVVAVGGVIKNIGVVASYVIVRHNDIGGLVGDNYGTIINSYVTGSVSGSGYVGGLVGYNNSGNISNSYATGAVTGSNYYVGGLVGRNYLRGTISSSYATGAVTGSNYNVGGLVGQNFGSTIINSYATGAVTGSYRVGGLAGANNNDGATGPRVNISNSYSTGAVTGNSYVGGLVGYGDGAVNNSYWNIETSGTEVSVGGTGRTTNEMKYRASYINSLDLKDLDINDGWDFIDIWGISSDINDGYPYLRANPPPSDDNNSGNGGFIMPSPFLGSGMEADPYIINSEWQLAYIVLMLNACDEIYSSAYFKLGNSISLGIYGEINSAFSIDLYNNWLKRCSFSGVLDGNNYEISGFIGDLEALLSGYIENGNVINLEIENKSPSSSSTETPSSSSSAIETPSSNSNNTSSSSSSTTTPSSSSGNETPIILPQIANNQISVKAINGGILLENLPSNAKVELYNLQGKRVYLGNSGNSKILRILILTKGMYIVKTGTTIQHIVVK